MTQNFLQKAAGIAGDVSSLISPVGGIVSAVKGIGSLLGLGGKSDEELMREQAELQYKYQTKLNEQQQEYARENAETEYSRQRELTADQFTLEKQGKRAAGMSTVMGDGSHLGAASVPSIATPNAGSAGMADPNIFADRQYKEMQNAVGLASVLSTMQKNNAEVEGIELDNNLKRESLASQLSILRSKASSAASRASIDKIQARIDSLYADSNAHYDNIMKEVAASFAKDKATADLQQTLQTIENLKMQYKKGSQEYKNLVTAGDYAAEQLRQLVVAGAYQPKMLDLALRKGNSEVGNINMDSRLKGAQIGLAIAQTSKTNSERDGIELDNDLKFATNKAKARICEEMMKTAIMNNVPTDIRGLIKEAVFRLDVGDLPWTARKQASDALDVLIKQEANKRGNDNVQSNIAMYQSLKNLFDFGDAIK